MSPFDQGVMHLASWIGNAVLPVLAGLIVALGVVEFSLGRSAGRYFVGALAALMGSAFTSGRGSLLAEPGCGPVLHGLAHANQCRGKCPDAHVRGDSDRVSSAGLGRGVGEVVYVALDAPHICRNGRADGIGTAAAVRKVCHGVMASNREEGLGTKENVWR